MKIAIITDTHFGVHKNNDKFLESQLKFFRLQFIPYLKENSITKIIMMGDLFDNRQQTNTKVMNEVFTLFSEDLKEFEVHLIAGNHDIYYRTTTEVNSLKFLGSIENVTIYEKISDLTIDSKRFCLIPWLPDHEVLRTFSSTLVEKYDAAFGHLEVTGFLLNTKMSCDGGLSIEDVLKISDKVFSGHFHTRAKKEYGDSFIDYIGNPYHLTRHDIGQNKGFTIFDVDTLKYEYVDTKIGIEYKKLVFPEKFDRKVIEGNVIDLYVDKSKEINENNLKLYVEKISSYNPLNGVKIVYENAFANVNYDTSEAQTTEEMIIEYVENREVKRKQPILEKLLNLYNECKKSYEV